MNFRNWAVAGIVAAAGSLFGWQPAARADDVPATAKIAVCNPLQVFKDCMEGKDDSAKWTQQGSQLKSEASAEDANLKSQAASIGVLKHGSDEYDKAIEDLTNAEINGQAKLKAEQVNLVRHQRAEQVALIQKIFKKVSDLAAAQNINIVFNAAHPDFPEDMSQMEDAQFLQTVVMHQVLYAGPAVDITGQVTIAMDKDYSTTTSGGH